MLTLSLGNFRKWTKNRAANMPTADPMIRSFFPIRRNCKPDLKAKAQFNWIQPKSHTNTAMSWLFCSKMAFSIWNSTNWHLRCFSLTWTKIYPLNSSGPQDLLTWIAWRMPIRIGTLVWQSALKTETLETLGLSVKFVFASLFCTRGGA